MSLLPRLRCILPLVLAGLLQACAQIKPVHTPESLLRDELFAPSAENVDATRIFAMTDAMRHYADGELVDAIGHRDPRRALVEALQHRRGLRLDYDATRTGNAAETFEARAGNCLSLVIMTGAFARHLGLPVTYRQVSVDPQYARAGGLTLEVGHVNILMTQLGLHTPFHSTDLIVDFEPTPEGFRQGATALDERTVVAMYMNNRAAETLAEGRTDDAYAWVRAAMRQAPAYAAAVNTLAVVYMRRKADDAAEAALRYVLALEPDNKAAMSNLVTVLQRAGRTQEAETVAAALKRLQPLPPFHFYEAGRRALDAGQLAEARELFARELRRQPYQHEVHFWAAQAAWRLGDRDQAVDHLRQARDFSPTVANQKLYGAKLDRLRELSLQ